MATYEHLANLDDGAGNVVDKDLFRNRIGVAAGIVAQEVNADPAANPTAGADVTLQGQRKELASMVVSRGPEDAGDLFLWAVIFANDTASIAAIRDATDGVIKTNVEDIWDLIAESSIVNPPQAV